MKITTHVVDPNLVQGTKIFEVQGQHKKEIGVSAGWITRTTRPGEDTPCPSTIDKIVVAPTHHMAQTAFKKAKLHQDPTVVSSSFSSRNVTELRVDDQGNTTERVVKYLLVAKARRPDPTKPPIADEIWFSNHPFLDSAAVKQAEKNCQAEEGVKPAGGTPDPASAD